MPALPVALRRYGHRAKHQSPVGASEAGVHLSAGYNSIPARTAHHLTVAAKKGDAPGTHGFVRKKNAMPKRRDGGGTGGEGAGCSVTWTTSVWNSAMKRYDTVACSCNNGQYNHAGIHTCDCGSTSAT